MNKYIYSFIIFLLTALPLSAQTAKQAEKLFNEGEYEKAKAAYQKLIKSAPNNAGYNFFLGASHYELGEKEEAQAYLEKSAARKYINAYYYLGKLYFDMHRYEDAIENYETHIEWLEEKDRDTSKVEEELNFIQHYVRMLKGVEKVTVIDSIIINKEHFLEAYKISTQSGSISKQDNNSNITYKNEMGNKRLFSDSIAGGIMQLYTQSKLIDEWDVVEPIHSINEYGNVNYPYLMEDGVTLYFASDMEGTLGGYDIYVTRYDSEDNKYLKPTNLGMPFNSTANDYMMVIDEFSQLGWFASDRNQPEDTVCIYVFIPNESKHTYNYENTDIETIVDAATLRNIQKTWQNQDLVEKAQRTLDNLRKEKTNTDIRKDFTFIVNDHATYHTFEDFRSDKARNSFMLLLQKEKDLKQLQASLKDKRQQYLIGQEKEKNQLKPSILDLEKRIPLLRKETEKLQMEVRNYEIQENK